MRALSIGILAASICINSSLSPALAQDRVDRSLAENPLGLRPSIVQARPQTSDNNKLGLALPHLPNSFQMQVDEYFDYVFKMHPSRATYEGLHAYDDELEDYSAKAIGKQIHDLKDFLKRFEAIDVSTLAKEQQLDHQLVVNDIRAALLELEQIQGWKKNPDLYSSALSESVFTLIKRKFAPAEERMKAVIARELKMPQVLREARYNLENPPKVYTEIALEQLPGIIDFFQTAVPGAFTDVADETLKSQFKVANTKVISALRDYQKWLKNDLLPVSYGEFALGPKLFAKKLLYEEMIDEPLDSLRQRGYDELHRLQKEFVETSLRLDSQRSPREVFESISKDHPNPDELIGSVSNVLEDIRKYCVDKGIVSIPSEERVKVEETPPFLRALSFASMDTPGPFEQIAKEAFYNVTLPEKDWSARKTEEHMRSFSRPDLLNTSVHEAYPGHYVQFLWVQKAPSKVRKLVGCNSNAEGWAHYCEQMMLEQGFGNGDTKLKLVQLHDALLRACRYIVGLEMHTGKMSMKQGIEFFINEGYQERASAERETKRGTADPTYLVYTLGKMQILKLRDDYKNAKGEAFTLQDFHDRFLAQGFPPLKIVRAALLDQD